MIYFTRVLEKLDFMGESFRFLGFWSFQKFFSYILVYFTNKIKQKITTQKDYPAAPPPAAKSLSCSTIGYLRNSWASCSVLLSLTLRGFCRVQRELVSVRRFQSRQCDKLLHLRWRLTPPSLPGPADTSAKILRDLAEKCDLQTRSVPYIQHHNSLSLVKQ